MTAQNEMAQQAPVSTHNQTPETQHVDRATLIAAATPAKPAAVPAPDRKRSSRLADDRRFKIFSGSANPALCEEVCQFLGVPVGQTKLVNFSDGEIHFQLLENVRGADVFLLQPTSYPVQTHLMELLIMIDALKRASAGRITVVIPYYGYAR